MTEKLLRIKEVAPMVGVKREGLLKWVREGKFPPPIKVSQNVSVWPESVVQGWIKALMDRQEK